MTNLEFKESDVDLIKSIREQINVTLNELRKRKDLPEEVKHGFAILKENGKVYYVPFGTQSYNLLRLSANNSKHLCNNCQFAYADKCPKVAAPNSSLGKCIEDFDFIKDGIEIIAGTDVSQKTLAKTREFFTVTNCSCNS